MAYTKDMIIELLTTLKEKKTRIELLKFDLTHPVKISESEMLSAMALGAPVNDGILRDKYSVSDKTMRIALSYKDVADRINRKSVEDMSEELLQLVCEVERLEFYMKFLSEEQRKLLDMLYINKRKWPEIEKATGLSRRTLNRRKEDALKKLAEMYGYIEGFKK